VFDFTDAAKPVEIAFFDRGPIDAKQLVTGGYWSTYWYNGFIYGTEIARGVDVFALKPSEYLTENEIAAALAAKVETFNAQDQARIVWPADPVVARAYLDQLNRTKGIHAERAAAVTAAVDRAATLKAGKDGAVADQLDALAKQVESDAAAATPADAARLRALGATLKGVAAAHR
jgi:hypothetical protein